VVRGHGKGTHMKRLTLVCQMAPWTGYGMHAIEIVRGMERLGVYVTVRPMQYIHGAFGAELPADIRGHFAHGIQPEEWELLLCPPRVAPTPGKRTIYYSMHESTRLPQQAVGYLNQAEAVIVPCEWCRQNFVASGVNRPIWVVPLGVDPKLFHYRPMRMDGPTVFGTAGRLAHGNARKGVNQVIRAFTEGFRLGTEPVRLEVKCYPDCPVFDCGDPRVTIHRGHWTPEACAEWLNHLTCYVSGATGEGWGLWQHQASACGRPVIGAIYGGLAEWLEGADALPVAFSEEPAQEGYSGCGKWAEPDWSSVIEAMRSVAANRAGTAIVGELAAESVRHLTWENSVRRLLDVVIDAIKCQNPKMPATYEALHCWGGNIPSFEAQCVGKGWEHGEFNLPRGVGEVCFNPSIHQREAGLTLHYRKANVNPKTGDLSQSRIMEARLANTADGGIGVMTERCQWANAEDPRTAHGPLDHFGTSFTRVEKGIAQAWFVPPVGKPFKLNYGGNDGRHAEKSWVWFWDDGWKAIYQTEPHTILSVNDAQEVEWVIESRQTFPKWRWGRPRGGTPPTRWVYEKGTFYLRFFHSRLPWKAQHNRYYVGAYLFDCEPPYTPRWMTPEPILVGSPNDPLSPIPKCCLYPGGAVFDGETWMLSLGINDERAVWVKIPHEDLRLESV